MAGLGSFAVDLIGALGGKPTKQSQKLFQAWQQREGGWTNNSATYNPLNLTAPGSGLPTINSVGVVAIPSYQQGVKRTADLIRTGYPAIYQALRTGQVDFTNPALQADFNRWVSGNRTPGMTKYVSGVAQSFGQNIPVSNADIATPGATPATPDAVAPLPVMKPQFDPMTYAQSIMGQYAQGGKMDMRQLPGMVASSYITPPPPPAAPGATPTQVAATPGAATPSQPSASGKPLGPGIRELFYDPLGAYDEGNWISPIGGHSDHVHVSFGTPQAAMQTIKLAQSMGLRASENAYAEGSDPEQGVHTGTSYHYQTFPGQYKGGKSKTLGRGLDVSGDPAKMAAFFKQLRKMYGLGG